MPELNWKNKEEKHAQRFNHSQDIFEFQVLEFNKNPIISNNDYNEELLKIKRSRSHEQEKNSNDWKNLLIWG